MTLSKKTMTTVAAIAAMGMMGLAACSGGSGDTASSDSASGDVVEIDFHTWQPTQDQWPELVEAFNKQYPNIKINFSRDEDFSAFKAKLDNAILADDMPDVWGVQVGAAFDEYASYAMPVEEYASEWVDKVNATARKQATTNDGVEGAVPILLAGSEYYLYNQTLMDELGIEKPTTYDEVVAASKKAREAGYSPFAMGAKDAWHDSDFFVWMSNQFGEGDVYKAAAGEIPWDSDSLVQAGEAWKALFTEGVFQDGATTVDTYPQARDDYFMARKAVFMPTGSWHVGAALTISPEVPGTAIEKDVIGMDVFPTIGSTDAGQTSGVDVAFAITDGIDEAKKDAAAKFIEFMAVGEGQQLWVNTLQGFPVAEGVEIQLGDEETDLGKESVELVSKTLSEAKYDRKLSVPGKESLENDLGVVLQNIAGGADVKTELATLN